MKGGDDFMMQLAEVSNDIETGLKGRDLLSLLDYTSEEVLFLIDKAIKLKKDTAAGKLAPILAGKTLGMIFEKHSTRTRISFEVGMIHLGGHAMFMNARDLQIGRGESI